MTVAFAEQHGFATVPAPRPQALLTLEPSHRRDSKPPKIETGLESARWLAGQHPEEAVYWSRLAHSALAAGELKEARDAASQAIDLAGDESALVSAAIALLAMGDSRSAEAALARGATHAARFLHAAIAVEHGEYDQALARIKGVDTPQANAMVGWLSLQAHNYRAAIGSFRRALEPGRPMPDVLVNLGYSFGVLGERRKALRTAIEAANIAPRNRCASRNLVSFYTAYGRFADARRELRRIEQEFPNDLLVLGQRVSVEIQANNVTRAGQILKGIRHTRAWWAASDSERSEIRPLLVLFDLEHERLPVGKALAELRTIIKDQSYTNIASATAYLSLLTDTRQAAEADAVLRELSKIHSETELQGPRALTTMLHLRFDDAAEMARTWVNSDPYNMTAAMTSNGFLSTVGDYEEAVKVIRGYLRNVDAHMHLANALAYPLACLGRFGEARAALERDTRNGPFVIATQALIDLYEGRVAEGKRGYDKAVRQARKRYGDNRWAALIAVRKELALRESGEVDETTALTIDPLIRDDVRLALLLEEYRRRKLSGVRSSA